MSAEFTPPVLYRYELKYIIPDTYIEPISQFVTPYCHLDEFSEKSHDKFYVINNLYFDTQHFTFLKNRIAEVNGRFNMRARSYGDNPLPPYYLEIKQKTNSILQKIRAKIGDDDWPGVLKDPFYNVKKTDTKNSKNLETYIRLALQYGIEPKVFTQYRRKAYISHCDEYGRLTFDKNLRFRQEHGYSLQPSNTLVKCDSGQLSLKCNEVILELKCHTNAVPIWMIDLIRTFQLQKAAFSKYLVGMRDVIQQFDADFSSLSPYLKNA